MNSTQITSPRQDSWLESLPVLILLLFLILVLGGGCSPSARPSDQEEGRKALQAVLDAWKKGARPDAFARENPAIHAADGDWMSGLALQGYRSTLESRLVGTDLNYEVELELKSPRGQLVHKTAVYAVTTHPQLLVLRMNE